MRAVNTKVCHPELTSLQRTAYDFFNSLRNDLNNEDNELDTRDQSLKMEGV